MLQQSLFYLARCSLEDRMALCCPLQCSPCCSAWWEETPGWAGEKDPTWPWLHLEGFVFSTRPWSILTNMKPYKINVYTQRVWKWQEVNRMFVWDFKTLCLDLVLLTCSWGSFPSTFACWHSKCVMFWRKSSAADKRLFEVALFTVSEKITVDVRNRTFRLQGWISAKWSLANPSALRFLYVFHPTVISFTNH